MIILLEIIGYVLMAIFMSGVIHGILNEDLSHSDFLETPTPLLGGVFWPAGIVIILFYKLMKRVNLVKWGYHFGEYLMHPTLPKFKRVSVSHHTKIKEYTGTIHLPTKSSEEIEAEAEVEEITRQQTL